MRFSEPHILFTDGILGVLAIFYAFFLIRINDPKKKPKNQVAWIGYWISIGFVALLEQLSILPQRIPFII